MVRGGTKLAPRSRGKDGPTKTRKSEGHVPLHPALAYQLKEWHAQTPYARPTDFIFPSLKAEGCVPVSPAVFVADHLRPAALKAGVQIPDGHRFGLHNMRHSLSHWLVNKAKVEPKTVQTILRHSRIQTTLDIYTQGDGDETKHPDNHDNARQFAGQWRIQARVDDHRGQAIQTGFRFHHGHA